MNITTPSLKSGFILLAAIALTHTGCNSEDSPSTSVTSNNVSAAPASTLGDNASGGDSGDTSAGAPGGSSGGDSGSYSGGGKGGNSTGPQLPPGLVACSGNVIFDSLPISLTDLGGSGIIPLGNLNPPAHTFPTFHTYYQIKDSNGGGAPVDKITVYAPGDMIIGSISSVRTVASGKTDYKAVFYPCADFEGYFDHLSELSADLKSAFDAASGNCQTYDPGTGNVELCSKPLSFAIKSGAVLGSAGGPTTDSAALDFGGRDKRVSSLSFVTPARLQQGANGFDLAHVVCPSDYFRSDLKAQLEAKYAGKSGANPACGVFAQDLKNTAQGLWYLAGTTNPVTSEASHFAFAHSNTDPSKPVLSVGNSTVGSGAFSYTASNSGLKNRDPAEISADGNVYCFESLTKSLSGGSAAGIIFILQIPTAATLKLEKKSANACGDGPWTFSQAAVAFER